MIKNNLLKETLKFRYWLTEIRCIPSQRLSYIENISSVRFHLHSEIKELKSLLVLHSLGIVWSYGLLYVSFTLHIKPKLISKCARNPKIKIIQPRNQNLINFVSHQIFVIYLVYFWIFFHYKYELFLYISWTCASMCFIDIVHIQSDRSNGALKIYIVRVYSWNSAYINVFFGFV